VSGGTPFDKLTATPPRTKIRRPWSAVHRHLQGGIMVSALVLLNVSRGAVNEVGQQLAEMDGVSEVYSVGGRFDLVAVIRVKNNEQLALLVTEQMLQVEGITASETLIAFRVFSRHDLEAMFSIGV
jgi:DNA-binding Lrp family transcriptional regulator